LKMIKIKAGIIIIFSILIFSAHLLLNHLISVKAFAQISPSYRAADKLDKEQQSSSQELVIERPKREYRADDLRDPFIGYEEKQEEPAQASSAPKEKPLPTLKIQGIIWGGRIPQAIINNKVVKMGDVIEGVKVVNINKDGVIVLFEDKEHNLSSPVTTHSKDTKGGKDEK